jgi:antitoxin component YwqK of YwqJK toxin-antitoxin module
MYFNLLDKASLFNLLLRVHYDDLQNLPNYKYITNTEHFKEQWESYNIITITTTYPNTYTIHSKTQVDRLGRRHGKHVGWRLNKDSTIFKELKCYYQCDKLHGPYIRWQQPQTFNRVLERTCIYVNGYINGTLKKYGWNGLVSEEINYSNGILHGKNIEWNSYAVIPYPRIETTYDDGFKHGSHKKWFNSTTLIFETTYNKGIANGLFKSYYVSGNIEDEFTYVNGQIHGKRLTYHDTGQVSSESFYISGKICGLVTEYTPNGNIHKQFTYRDGMRLLF